MGEYNKMVGRLVQKREMYKERYPTFLSRMLTWHWTIGQMWVRGGNIKKALSNHMGYGDVF